MKKQVMPAIDILLQPSWLLLGASLLISILACLSVIIVVMPFDIKLCLLAVIIFSSIYFILRDVLYALPWSWRRVEVTGFGELRLTNQRGQQFKPTLHASSFIHPSLIILNTQKRVNLSLAPVLIFSYFKEQHRQLRVWLKWWKHQYKLVNDQH